MSGNKNDNDEPSHDPAVVLDQRRGLKAQHETDARRRQSAVRADQDALREGQASLEKHLFGGAASNWQDAAEKASYLLRRFAATGEGQDPRYKQLVEETLDDLLRLSGKANGAET